MKTRKDCGCEKDVFACANYNQPDHTAAKSINDNKIWTVKHIRDTSGFRELTIFQGGRAIANMVMQLDDSELLKAHAICDAMNALELRYL